MRSQKFIRDGLEVQFEVVNQAKDIVPAIIERAKSSDVDKNERLVAEKF